MSRPTSNPDGSPQSISGTGQRAQQYSYDINGKNIATTVRLTNNAILSQDIINGFGQTVVQAEPNTLGGFIYTRSEYNAKGQSLSSAQKPLISQLNSSLEGKIISVNERNLTSENWTVYNEATKRLQYSTAPTSAITAETVMVSGFALLQEVAGEIIGYQANALNQYAMLSVDDIADFIPSYDAAGNQCRVKTSTGIWAISYDAENRPTGFTKIDASGSTSIHCEYDYMGRRATKQVTTNGNITLHQRYIYRGYLQIAALDLTRSTHPALWYITWDPTQPIATRPLAIQKDGTWFTYGWDLTKNICEVYGPAGYIRTAYTYTPYGEVSTSGDITQPIQWSSEFNDTELGLVYYNYRHYNLGDGRWLGRDKIVDPLSHNYYSYICSKLTSFYDYLGLKGKKCEVVKLEVIDIWGGRKKVPHRGTLTVRKPFKDLPRLGAYFSVEAEFKTPDCGCCEMRQYVLTSDISDNPAFQNRKPKKFYEDIDEKGTGYGYRSAEGDPGFDYYYTENPVGDRVVDQRNGNHYLSTDAPTSEAHSYYIFRVIIIDTCNKNKIVKTHDFSIIWETP